MDAVLTRLRDFSCRDAAFVVRDPLRTETLAWRGDSEQGSGKDLAPAQLDIPTALAWLRRELMEMRSLDQLLIRQLMELHAGIQELKLECVEAEWGVLGQWDSQSSSSSLSSGSGDMGCNINTRQLRWYPAHHPFRRRSSVP